MGRTLCILFRNNDYKGPEPERLYHIPREYFVCKVIDKGIDTIGIVEENCTVIGAHSLREDDEFSTRTLELMLDIFLGGMTVEETLTTG